MTTKSPSVEKKWICPAMVPTGRGGFEQTGGYWEDHPQKDNHPTTTKSPSVETPLRARAKVLPDSRLAGQGSALENQLHTEVATPSREKMKLNPKPKGQNMNKIKELLRDIFAPKIYINKKYYGPKPFPEKEWDEVWKKHKEAFDLMEKLFKKHER